MAFPALLQHQGFRMGTENCYTRLLGCLAPGLAYDKGLVRGKERVPFHSFCSLDGGHWSDEMADSLEDASKNHFIDLYNRRITLDSLAPALSLPEACYIDVGCSSGYMIEDVSAKYPSAVVCGCDYFPAGLHQCHSRLPEVPLFQADIVRAPVGEEMFDAISCLNVLEHIEDDLAALRSMYKMLKPSGLIAVTVPLGQHLYDMYDEVHYHVRRYSLKELLAKMRKAGFKTHFANTLGFIVYPAFYLTKKLNRLRYSTLNFEEKQKRAFGQIASTKSSFFMNKLCALEYACGRKLQYPSGVRGFVLAGKQL